VKLKYSNKVGISSTPTYALDQWHDISNNQHFSITLSLKRHKILLLSSYQFLYFNFRFC